MLDLPAFDLPYKVYLNPASTVPVASFIIQAYAEEFAAKFNKVDLWVIRSSKRGNEVVARNPHVVPYQRTS